jgi:DNA-binding XRE family transcriptional regulator
MNGSRYTIELEPEVEKWLETLTPHDHGRVMFYADLLADFDGILDEPYTRHLGRKVRELRFHLGRSPAPARPHRLRPLPGGHSMSHTRWEITDADRAREGYQEARRAYLFGKAIRDRRTALGMTQTQLAARAGMSQAAISRLEHGGSTPTIPLLERLAAALDSTLHLDIPPNSDLSVTFTSCAA